MSEKKICIHRFLGNTHFDVTTSQDRHPHFHTLASSQGTIQLSESFWLIEDHDKVLYQDLLNSIRTLLELLNGFSLSCGKHPAILAKEPSHMKYYIEIIYSTITFQYASFHNNSLAISDNIAIMCGKDLDLYNAMHTTIVTLFSLLERIQPKWPLGGDDYEE